MKDGKQLAQEVLDYVNTMSADHTEFIDTIMDGHRTLQQSTFGLMLETINTWAEQERYDLRNEATIEGSKRVKELEIYLPLI